MAKKPAPPVNPSNLTTSQKVAAVTHALCIHFQHDTGRPCSYATLLGAGGLGFSASSLQIELNTHIAPLFGVGLRVSDIAQPQAIVNLAEAIVAKMS